MDGIQEVPMCVDVRTVNRTTTIEKKCGTCKETKKLSEFYVKSATYDGRTTQCRACVNKINKQWKDNHREIRKHKNREYHLSHKETRNAAAREWIKSNPEKARASVREYSRKIRKTPHGKLNSSMAGGIWAALRGAKKGARWEHLVGYNVEQLKQHLEKQFTPEMTWKNHGKYWHIDHKIPRSVFNYERPEDIDFKRCWSLQNLRPLRAFENISKGARLLEPFQPALAF